MSDSNRFNLSEIKNNGENNQTWSEAVADQIISLSLDENKKEKYTVAAGISPSGIVHFGNFRDIMTVQMVKEALEKKGKKVKFIFSWDNFDRLRKVPVGVSESFVQYVGKPLSKIPDPFGTCHISYAEHFQSAFVQALEKLGIEIEYRNQTELYESGVYDEMIKFAMGERKKIAEILVFFMSEKAIEEKKIDTLKYIEDFYPISVYSRFTGKDSTKILEYHDNDLGDMQITYLCLETQQKDTVNLKKEHIAKLNWKIDWPMRWKYEKVCFEPGGSDHAAPGGSYDVSSKIAKNIFKIDPPTFVEYLFVGIRGLGVKMSGSKGNAVSVLDLLEIYDPKILKWLYQRRDPNQSFQLAFDSEVFRQYDEYDKVFPEVEPRGSQPISFKQMVGLGQILQWQIDKIFFIIKDLDLNYSEESVRQRLPLARNWLVKYNASEIIELRKEKNKEYFENLPENRKDFIKKLYQELKNKIDASVADLEFLTYQIPKDLELPEVELKKIQRTFFQDIYNLLISKDTGPRLGIFLWSTDRNKVLELLEF
ncbi:MAG: lysine--tRNA ligase [Patescibacteria group bacterium]